MMEKLIIYSDNDTMYLIQGKSTENLTFDEIKNAFFKIVNTVEKFDEKKYDDFSQILKTVYINAYDDLSDDKNIELILFTKTVLSDDIRRKLKEFSIDDSMKNYKLVVYDKEDIEERESVIAQDSDLIEEDKITIMLNEENKNNVLAYGENGIIVNVMASSVKHLYEKYANRGLFSYNLREHINQKNVDDAIDRTISQEKDKFWFYNNGITIGCEDFRKDGNCIKLYGFSIINGAQTTDKIGKSKLVNEKNDFVLSCKIVKAENSIEKDGDFTIRQLEKIYETKKDSMKITSYSNYFKTEPLYEMILKEFDELDDYDMNKLQFFMTVFEEKKSS